MRTNFAKIVLPTLLSAACGMMYSAPSNAQDAEVRYRSFYQNAGSNCHGTTPTNENRLRRYPQSLRNTSTSTASVVCNLTTDLLSITSPSEGGTASDPAGNVLYVAIWAKNLSTSTPRSMICTLTDGFVNEAGSANYPSPNLTLATGTAQTPFAWTPSGGKSFLAPINIACALPPNTELNDWWVVYQVGVGT